MGIKKHPIWDYFDDFSGKGNAQCKLCKTITESIGEKKKILLYHLEKKHSSGKFNAWTDYQTKIKLGFQANNSATVEIKVSNNAFQACMPLSSPSIPTPDVSQATAESSLQLGQQNVPTQSSSFTTTHIAINSENPSQDTLNNLNSYQSILPISTTPQSLRTSPISSSSFSTNSQVPTATTSAIQGHVGANSEVSDSIHDERMDIDDCFPTPSPENAQSSNEESLRPLGGFQEDSTQHMSNFQKRQSASPVAYTDTEMAVDIGEVEVQIAHEDVEMFMDVEQVDEQPAQRHVEVQEQITLDCCHYIEKICSTPAILSQPFFFRHQKTQEKMMNIFGVGQIAKNNPPHRVLTPIPPSVEVMIRGEKWAFLKYPREMIVEPDNNIELQNHDLDYDVKNSPYLEHLPGREHWPRLLYVEYANTQLFVPPGKDLKLFEWNHHEVIHWAKSVLAESRSAEETIQMLEIQQMNGFDLFAMALKNKSKAGRKTNHSENLDRLRDHARIVINMDSFQKYMKNI